MTDQNDATAQETPEEAPTATEAASDAAPDPVGPRHALKAQAADEQYKPWPDCAGYPLTKPINQAQLASELEKALGSVVQIASTSGSLGSPGTVEGTLWVMPSSADPAVVQATLDAHVMDPNWGVPESVQSFRAVMAKVQANPDVVLTEDELQTAVRGVLVRLNNQV